MWRPRTQILLTLVFASGLCLAQQSTQPASGNNAAQTSSSATQASPAPASGSDGQSTNGSAVNNVQTSPPATPGYDNIPVPDSAQPAVKPQASVAASNPASPNDSLPPTGFSSYTSVSGQHDSSTGWSTVLNSSLRYDFNPIFGMEVGVPLYLMHNGYDSAVPVRGKKNPPIVTSYNSLGDVAVTLNFAVPKSAVGYRSTIMGTAPTGDTSSGISTGRPTVDFNNHFDHSFGPVSPLLELGVGDSSTLINKRVRRPFTTLGALSHFMAGAGFDLFKDFNFQADAYENLPIGNQKVYRTEYVRYRTATGAVRLRRVRIGYPGLTEDNGCEGTLSTPLGPFMDLSATYDRSFRQKLDTVSVTLGFRIRKSQSKHKAQ